MSFHFPHLTDTQAAICFIGLAIGGILLIWHCCKPPLGPKPQPREVWPPLFELDDLPVPPVPPVRKPAGKAKSSNRKRDKRGRFA